MTIKNLSEKNLFQIRDGLFEKFQHISDDNDTDCRQRSASLAAQDPYTAEWS